MRNSPEEAGYRFEQWFESALHPSFQRCKWRPPKGYNASNVRWSGLPGRVIPFGSGSADYDGPDLVVKAPFRPSDEGLPREIGIECKWAAHWGAVKPMVLKSAVRTLELGDYRERNNCEIHIAIGVGGCEFRPDGSVTPPNHLYIVPWEDFDVALFERTSEGRRRLYEFAYPIRAKGGVLYYDRSQPRFEIDGTPPPRSAEACGSWWENSGRRLAREDAEELAYMLKVFYKP